MTLKALSSVLETSRLSFASPDRLKIHLGIDPGSVSLLAVLNDSESKMLRFSLTKEIWQDEAILCHPLVNTSTLVVPLKDMKLFLKKTGHGVRLIEVPVGG